MSAGAEPPASRAKDVHPGLARLKSADREPDDLLAMRMQEIKRRIQRSEYVVDPRMVAEAMLRHAISYRRWWNPRKACATPAEVRFTVGEPAETRPTQVTPAPAIARRPSCGPQTQSS